jgi:hypothetical protein
MRALLAYLALLSTSCDASFESAADMLLAAEHASVSPAAPPNFVRDPAVVEDGEDYKQKVLRSARDAVAALAMGALHGLELSLLLLLLVVLLGAYAGYRALGLGFELFDTARKRRSLETMHGLTTGGPSASGITRMADNTQCAPAKDDE